MKAKTSELIGPALNWAVARCEGITILPKLRGGLLYTYKRGVLTSLDYSTDWRQGGPIIERKEIFLAKSLRGVWNAMMYTPQNEAAAFENGPTPLIAAMRCYVASKLSDEVEIPEELVVLEKAAISI